MICRDSIEEKILLLQQRKQHLSENLIAEEEGFVKNLTEEDVAFLFS
jgi:SNF2 family DNA or RNA helicase